MCAKHSVSMHGNRLSWLQRRAMVTRVTNSHLTNGGIVSSSLFLLFFFPFPHLLMSPYPSVATAQLPPTPQATPRNSSSCSGLSMANALSFSANSNLMNYSLPTSDRKVCTKTACIMCVCVWAVVGHCPSNDKVYFKRRRRQLIRSLLLEKRLGERFNEGIQTPKRDNWMHKLNDSRFKMSSCNAPIDYLKWIPTI